LEALPGLVKPPPGFLLVPGLTGVAAYDSSRRAARTIQKKESFMLEMLFSLIRIGGWLIEGEKSGSRSGPALE
jgi:hypothetical protein